MAAVIHLILCVFILHTLGQANAAAAFSQEGASPIQTVVTLIGEMKAEVEKAADADLAAHDKYMCWCETNFKEKTAAIEIAGVHIEELSAFIEEADGTESRLEEQISAMEADVAADQDALRTAAALHEKEHAEFLASEKDSNEVIALLKEAVATLSKVQLLQHQSQGGGARHGEEAEEDDEKEARTSASVALVQVREKVLRRHPKFQSIMQRDLFDLVGSIDTFLDGAGIEAAVQSSSSAASFLGRRAHGGGHSELALMQQEDSIGEPTGAAAGAKSYNARSGGILGILSQMLDEMQSDLTESQKADAKAETAFQKLSATKTKEITIATEQVDRKTATLANLRAKEAEAKEDMKATAEAKEADQRFLANMEKSCSAEDEDYKVRAKVRSEEIVALAETLKILTEDDARDVFGRTSGPSFMQLGSTATASALARARSQARSKTAAARRVAQAARRQGSTHLAVLAVSVQLDAFKEAKAAMDKMMAELQKQQKEEASKKDFCAQEIDKTEDGITSKTNKKEDLDDEHLQLSNALDSLTKEMEELKKEEEEMKVSLKKAGEQRKEENQIFQTSVKDAHAMVNILNKANDRLKAFYSFAQVRSHNLEQVSDEAVAPPPPKPKAYQKSGGGGGVIQLLAKIIQDAEVEAQELEAAEQTAQADYAQFVKDTAASMEAHRDALSEKAAQKAEADSARSETEQSQLATERQLEKLNALLQAHHLECDWLMKYFDTRQKARADEMDAITDAKAILSGQQGPGL